MFSNAMKYDDTVCYEGHIYREIVKRPRAGESPECIAT
jgi:hypothetical protein